MTDEPACPSGSAAARTRRAQKAAMRESLFEALASGFSYAEIAAARKVSVSTIRREIDKAIAARSLEKPAGYLHLQVARLTKALRLVDKRLVQGDLKAVGRMVQVVAALDRYHGLQDQRGLSHAEPPLPPAAPPLAIAHAAPPLVVAEAEVASVAGFDI